MSVWGSNPGSSTKDSRIRVAAWGPNNWRILCKEDDKWVETGPPYATKAEALVNIDTAIAYLY